MNLPSQTGNLLFVNFNQDASCLSIGTSEGFKICNTQPQYTEVYSQDMGGIGLCEMLFSSSLVSVVGSGDDPSLSPRKLLIVNTKTQKTLCELNFVTPILSVKMNKKRLVVVLETKIHIYDISTMKILHTLDTAPNPKGLCALSSSEEHGYLVFPASAERGSVAVFDAVTLQMMNVISAHKAPLSKLCLSPTGSLLATTSTKGTVIRAFSLPDASKSYHYRRGSYPAMVYSLSFSFDASLLCMSSDTGTVHVFKIEQSAGVAPSTSPRSMMSSYLSDMWDTMATRSFATLKVAAGVENLCAINRTNTTILIATSDGYFYHFNMDPKVGGELKLSSEYRLSSDSVMQL